MIWQINLFFKVVMRKEQVLFITLHKLHNDCTMIAQIAQFKNRKKFAV